MSDWFFDHIGWFVLALLIVFVALVVGVAKQAADAKAAFMAECLQDRKQYECTAMWRAGSGGSVVPMPVVIPVR